MSSFYGFVMHSTVLPLLLAPTRSRSGLTREIVRQQRRPLAELKAQQLKGFNKLLALALAESKFYQNHFAGLPGQIESLDDLLNYPITRKSDVEANFPDGMVVESRRNPDWQYVGTRGTTRRVMVVHDYDRRDSARAATRVAYTSDSPYRYGDIELTIPPDACSVHCGLESSRADSVSAQLFALTTRKVPWNRESVSDLRGLVMDNWIRRTKSMPPLQIDNGSDDLAKCINELRRRKPMHLVALPEYLRALANYILESNDRPHPIPVIRPMGANFPQSWRPMVEEAFRGKLREHYGSREMNTMAFDCKEQNGLHLLMDQQILEVVRDGRPVDDGEVGKVLVTDLQNHSMPIIRYEIGDLARIERTPCPCGRTTPRIFMEGRTEDAFVLSDGRIITAESVANFFTQCRCVRDYQLTEDNRGFLLRLVLNRDAESTDANNVADDLQRWLNDPRPIRTRVVDSILPEDSGKFRHCKSNSFADIEACAL